MTVTLVDGILLQIPMGVLPAGSVATLLTIEHPTCRSRSACLFVRDIRAHTERHFEGQPGSSLSFVTMSHRGNSATPR